MKLFKLVFCLFLLTCQLSVYAQQRTGNEGSSGGDASIKNLEFASLDTSSYQYFTLDDLKAKSVFKDSMIHNFSNYAPDRNADDPHLTLGNLGSAARPVLFKVNQNIGNQLGFHQYELYHKNLRNFRFMDVNIPFNNLFFSPLSGQQNFMVKANFSRNFKENTNFTLDYERLRQDGFYNQQGTKSTSFGVGVWNKSENLKRNTFFLLKASNNDESQNGGVANIDYTDLDAIFRQLSIAQRNAIVVNSRTAESRRQLYSYEMHNFYQLSNFKLQHSISFTKGYYRFYDTESIPDYYGQFYAGDDGIRNFYSERHWSNDASVAFDHGGFQIKTGAQYHSRKFDFDFNPINKNDLLLYGKIITDWSAVKLNGLVQLGLLDAAGNLAVNSNVEIPILDWMNLQGGFEFSRYNAALKYERLHINQVEIFDTNFSKTIETALHLAIEIPKTKTKLKWRTMVIDQAMYFDDQLLPIQNQGSIVGTQLSLRQDVRFWKIHFDNVLHYQSFDNNLFNLPTLYSRHDLHLNFPIFKRKLNTDLGVALINILQDNSIGFYPLLGSFYSSEQALPYYPYLELYGNFKINDFRVFIKLENATALWQSYTNLLEEDILFQIKDYPQFDNKIRFGVSWLLKN